MCKTIVVLIMGLLLLVSTTAAHADKDGVVRFA